MPPIKTPCTLRFTIENVFVIGLLVAVWLLSHPYQGIWHDGTLYAGQALQRLNPSAFHNDIFFAYGSQDQFTIFTPLYGWMINAVGINASAIGLLLVFQGIWFVAYWSLSRQFLEGRWLYLALILAFGLSTRYYGGQNIFSYAENFLTARSAAEAIGLAAMAIYFFGYRLTGLLIAMIATALHPLIGGWIAALLFLLRFGWRITSLFGVIGVAASPILLPSLFDSLITSMDAEWRELVVDNSSHVFIEYWGQTYWSQGAVTLSIICFAAMAIQGKAQRLWITLSGLSIVTIVLCLIGTTLFHSVLLTQLQLWRVLWLATAIQWIAAAQLIGTLWPHKAGRLWLSWLLIGWLLRDNIGGAIAVVSLLAFLVIRNKKYSPSPVISKWLFIATLATLAVAFLSWLPNAGMEAWIEGANYFRNETFISQMLNGLVLTKLGLLFILPLWWLISLDPSPTRLRTLSVTTIILLICGVLNWDQRYPLQRHIEIVAVHPENRPFGDLIKPGDTVYWSGPLGISWLALNTSQYASSKQVSGIVFNRRTALEIKRRLYRIAYMGLPLDQLSNATAAQLENELNKLGVEHNLRSKETFLITESGLVHLCHDEILDFAILSVQFPTMALAEYAIPLGKLRFWLYDCKAIRKHYADPLPAIP